nr:hypothetical protein Itr_chr07CG18880 [Ipomoea trifida]
MVGEAKTRIAGDADKVKCLGKFTNKTACMADCQKIGFNKGSHGETIPWKCCCTLPRWAQSWLEKPRSVLGRRGNAGTVVNALTPVGDGNSKMGRVAKVSKPGNAVVGDLMLPRKSSLHLKFNCQ